MKKKYAIITGCLLLALLVCAGFLYRSGRNRSLKEVCLLDAEAVTAGAVLYRNSPGIGQAEYVDLTQEEFSSLLTQMETITYKKIGSANAMGQDENYATLNYIVDQQKVEIMFSSTDGGRILVNVVGENRNAPLYQMVPSGEAIQEMLLDFSRSHPRPTDS